MQIQYTNLSVPDLIGASAVALFIVVFTVVGGAFAIREFFRSMHRGPRD